MNPLGASMLVATIASLLAGMWTHDPAVILVALFGVVGCLFGGPD